jgi:hypothetical protein
MPILPLDHTESYIATLGVMLFPGTTDDDQQKALSFAARQIAKATRLAHAEHLIPSEVVMRLYRDSGWCLYDDEVSWWDATATGQMFKTLWALYNSNPYLATWNNAFKIGEVIAVRAGTKGSRTDFSSAKRRFLPVAHLWGAWCLRGGKFLSHPEVGFGTDTDFQCFLAEAEVLRVWGQSWRRPQEGSKPFLPADVWRVPDGWLPPSRKPGWPEIGKLNVFTIPHDLLSSLRRAGRPAG